MSTPSRAVFLSYASEDASAAQRIAEALRTARIEVWFDKSELRGGDAWDAAIREQIKSCALLIPIISRNTPARGDARFAASCRKVGLPVPGKTRHVRYEISRRRHRATRLRNSP